MDCPIANPSLSPWPEIAQTQNKRRNIIQHTKRKKNKIYFCRFKLFAVFGLSYVPILFIPFVFLFYV